MPYAKKDNALDLKEINSKATLVLFTTPDTVLNDNDWEKIKELNIIWQNNFKLCVDSEADIDKAIQLGIKVFASAPAFNYQTFHHLLNLKVSDIRIAGPLAHDLTYINQFDVNIRVTANVPLTPSTINPIIGAWYRPEDLYQLEEIDICEFKGSALNPRAEEALFRIYKVQHKWPGKLEMLSKELPKNVDNRLLPDNFQERRSTCHQKCLMGSNCKWCYTAAHLANEKLFEGITKNK